MTALSSCQKLLTLLFNNGKKKPVLLHVNEIAKKWDVPAVTLRGTLLRYQDKGYIVRTDRDGNPVNGNDLTTAQCMLNVMMANGSTMPYDKKARWKICQRFGVTAEALRTITYRMRKTGAIKTHDGLISIDDYAVARDRYGVTPETAISNPIPTQENQSHYYMYVKGYKYPNTKVAKPKPPAKEIKHIIVEVLIAKGGEVWMTRREWATLLGCHTNSVKRCMQVLVNEGIIDIEPNYARIRNIMAAKLLLSPWTATYSLAAREHCPSSPIPSPLRTEASYLKPALVSAVISPRDVTAAKLIMLNLVKLSTEHKITSEIARRLLYYPKNYEKGQEVIRQMRDNLRYTQTEGEDDYKQQQGRMYGKQKAIVTRILDAVQTQFDLTGFVTEELRAFGVTELRGALPSIEMPDMDKAEQLADWMDSDLPADDLSISWASDFIGHSGSVFISEFAARGGLRFLMHLMIAAIEEVPANQARCSFQVLLYLAYLAVHPFDSKHPEWFKTPEMLTRQVMDDDSLYGREGIAVALAAYAECGFELGNLHHLAPALIEALFEQYPTTQGEEDGLFLTCGWDFLMILDVSSEAIDELHEWKEKYHDNLDVPKISAPPKHTISWYEQKMKDAQVFGLPGDLEAINGKISALRGWRIASDEKRKQLVGLLNRPTRYDDPRLSFEEWDLRAMTGRHVDIDKAFANATVDEHGMTVIRLNGDDDGNGE